MYHALLKSVKKPPVSLFQGLFGTNSDHLGLETRTENIAFPYETPWRGYLWGSSICSVISSLAMDKLTSLVLDTGASVIFDPPMDRLKELPTSIDGQVSAHNYQVISQRLHHLRRLWVRTCYICPSLLSLTGFSAKKETPKLQNRSST